MDHRKSLELLELELCPVHRYRMERLIRTHKTPVEAIQLYYGLKEKGVRAMLAWWDGRQIIDLAVSRVKLNIEIDRGNTAMTPKQAIEYLEGNMQTCENGFTNIRIPDFMVRKHFRETVTAIQGIIESLRSKVKVI